MTTLAKSAIFCGVMVVVCVGICCGTLSELFPYDDCMDNDIFDSIESNGHAIVRVNYETKRFEIPQTVTSHPPAFTTSQLKDGNSVLKVSANGKTWSRTDSTFSDDYWSSREQCYYFIEEKALTVSDRKWLYRWSSAKGFEELLELKGWVMSVSMSLDQSAVVIDNMNGGENRTGSFVVYNVRSGQTDFLPRADWASHPVMLSRDRFLVRRHETGHYGHVVRWSPKKEEQSHNSRDDLWIDGGEITDVACLDGSVWGLHTKGGDSHFVRLNKEYSKIEQDAGVVPGI